MEHYTTLFDSNYVYQGINLYKSLRKHCKEFQLWVICMDDEVFNLLIKLNFMNLRPLRLSDFETDALRDAKKGRTFGEYCWTMTPFTFEFVFQLNPEIKRLTYVDSDVWVRKNPEPIFNELEASGKSVLITDHGYAAEYDQSATSGQFCVQFLTFYRLGTFEIRSRWQTQCLEWCYNRVEANKFGDQKYLDEWPELYSNIVHILSKPEWTLAPWNATRFPYGNSIIYHFHGLKVSINENNSELSFLINGSYTLPDVLKQNIYMPYLQEANETFEAIKLTK